MNLRITGVLSKVCLLPNSAVREYLLDPTVQLSPTKCTSLYRCLVSSVQKMMDFGKEVPNFHEKVLNMRQLIRSSHLSNIPSDKESQICCGVILLEEFCEEISARAFVAYSNPVIGS